MPINRDLKARIADRFHGYELVEYLQLSVEDIIERFEDEIEEALDDLEEFIETGTNT